MKNILKGKIGLATEAKCDILKESHITIHEMMDFQTTKTEH